MTGNELRAQRLARGLTQRQVAEANHVSPSTVGDWERGKARVPASLRWPVVWRECWGEVTLNFNGTDGTTFLRSECNSESPTPPVGTIVQIRWTEATP